MNQSLTVTVVLLAAGFVFYNKMMEKYRPSPPYHSHEYDRNPAQIKHLERTVLNHGNKIKKLGYNNVGLTFTDPHDILGWGPKTKLIAQYFPGTKNPNYARAEPLFEYNSHKGLAKHPLPNKLFVNGKEIADPKLDTTTNDKELEKIYPGIDKEKKPGATM